MYLQSAFTNSKPIKKKHSCGKPRPSRACESWPSDQMMWLRSGRSFSRSTTLSRPMDSMTLLTWSEPLVALALNPPSRHTRQSLICGPAFSGTRRSATECTWLYVVIELNSNARWPLPLFCMPTRGKTVFSHLIFFLAPVERTAVAARQSSPGTGQEDPPLGHGRTKREGPDWAAVSFSLPQSHALSPTPLVETLAATTGRRRCSPRGSAVQGAAGSICR
jgi:hypothetical protein